MNDRSAITWAVTRGIAPAGPLTQRVLSGGVSSSIWAVEGPTGGIVVKRALARLNVEADWRADPRRSLSEAQALVVLRTITPERVPIVLDVDEETLTIAVELAPRDTATWRNSTLAFPADPRIGTALGATLAAWQRATWMPWPGAVDFDAGSASFEELRLAPFHGTIAGRFPRVADVVRDCADELRHATTCLVHGDLSPKNVLVGPGLLWVIDAEVAHIGDPIFDVAFMSTHLALTAIARPAFASSLEETWRAFVTRYLQDAPGSNVEARLSRHVGCLLLARTDGISREPGLDRDAVHRARMLGFRLLQEGGAPSGSFWEEVGAAFR
jgi:hypothetical protein